jgi:23S rRNA pseudouridine1911/1915/1917 synthase
VESARIKVLYEDNHLLAIDKPAGLPTIGVSEGHPSLAKLAKSYLKEKYQKPGNVYLGVMSRLDSLVSGVVLFARTSKAAARLTEQFREHTVDKIYWAIVEGAIETSSGSFEDWLAKSEARQRMEVVQRAHSGAQQALLEYHCLEKLAAASLVEVQLKTGRKHQIRLQFSARSHPVLGDQKYGSSRRFPEGIALHSRRLTVVHPTLGEPLTIECSPPRSWQSQPFRLLRI